MKDEGRLVLSLPRGDLVYLWQLIVFVICVGEFLVGSSDNTSLEVAYGQSTQEVSKDQ